MMRSSPALPDLETGLHDQLPDGNTQGSASPFYEAPRRGHAIGIFLFAKPSGPLPDSRAMLLRAEPRTPRRKPRGCCTNLPGALSSLGLHVVPLADFKRTSAPVAGLLTFSARHYGSGRGRRAGDSAIHLDLGTTGKLAVRAWPRPPE